jgi:hypothetical protein
MATLDTIQGSLYDLNAHYAKRLTSLVAEDGTIARQIPFFSLFKAAGLPSSQVPLDVVVTSTSPFAATATLREPTDQLFYASSFSIAANCLTSAALLKVGVQSLQQQVGWWDWHREEKRGRGGEGRGGGVKLVLTRRSFSFSSWWTLQPTCLATSTSPALPATGPIQSAWSALSRR